MDRPQCLHEASIQCMLEGFVGSVELQLDKNLSDSWELGFITVSTELYSAYWSVNKRIKLLDSDQLNQLQVCGGQARDLTQIIAADIILSCKICLHKIQ